MNSKHLIDLMSEISDEYLDEHLNYSVKKDRSLLKVAVIILAIIIIGSLSIVTGIKIYKDVKKSLRPIPTYTQGMSNTNESNIWVGTFNLVWNDFMTEVIHGNIEFEDGESKLADELNKQSFTVNDLNKDSYVKIHGLKTPILKEKIKKDIKERFNEKSEIINQIDFDSTSEYEYILYAMLKKEFNYPVKFDILKSRSFNNSEKKYKFFGIDNILYIAARKNIEVLFYNSSDDFAIKLKTRENDEVILYKTNNVKSFEASYNDILEKEKNYQGSRDVDDKDLIIIPFISLSAKINYDELCGRYIKGKNWYIKLAMQTVDFELNNVGGSVKSEAVLHGNYIGGYIFMEERDFIYDSNFILFLKETAKDKPYLALNVNSEDLLVLDEE